MYTTKYAVHRNDTGTPPPTMCEPGHFIKEVVGARICRNCREPLHIHKMFRRRDVAQENVVNHLTGDLKNNSDLRNLMTYIPISCTAREL